MLVNVSGLNKMTEVNGVIYNNVQSRFFTSQNFCNQTGARMGDFVELQIGNNRFVSKVSDCVTVPTKGVFSKEEIIKIKNGHRLKKRVGTNILKVKKVEEKFVQTPNFVGLLAHAFSDGSITTTSIAYTNKDKQLIEHFKQLSYSVFPKATLDDWNDDGIFQVRIENTFAVSVTSRLIQNFGRKSLTNPNVPSFVMENTNFALEWMKHVFSDDGWVNKASRDVVLARQIRFKNDELLESLKWQQKRLLKNNFPVIIAKLNKEQKKLVPRCNLIDDESKMLKNLGFNCYRLLRKTVFRVNNTISARYELYLPLKEFSNIGFCANRKQSAFEEIVKNQNL